MADQRQDGIAWTDETWNPVRGCALVSSGCTNCYAMRQAARMDHPGGAYEGLTRATARGPVWTGEARFVPELLDRPLRWTRPRRVFVNSMSDLFHESLTNAQIAAVFGVMAASPQHVFQVLTKRADRLASFTHWLLGCPATRLVGGDVEEVLTECVVYHGEDVLRRRDVRLVKPLYWPLSNVWLGVSVENQETADERVPALLTTPAAIRWVSYEPALGPVNFADVGQTTSETMWVLNALRGSMRQEGRNEPTATPRIDWLVTGGESGPHARPCDVSWLRSIVRQCRAAGVPCFVKQLGANYIDAENGVGGVQASPDPTLVPPIRHICHPKGGDPAEWPEGLRVREWPRERDPDHDNPLGGPHYDEDAFGRPVYDPPDDCRP